MKKQTVTASEVFGIAAKAGCDPRTVKKYLRGDEVRPLVAERIKNALREVVGR